MQVGYGCSICSYVLSIQDHFMVLSNYLRRPISTYGGQATLKPNLPGVDQHAIIYTRNKVPQVKQYKAANGVWVSENLTKDPIQVIREQEDKEGELAPTSRLNFSKLYTVEHNVRVLNIGMVHKNSMASLSANSFLRPNDPPKPPIEHPRQLGLMIQTKEQIRELKSKEKERV